MLDQPGFLTWGNVPHYSRVNSLKIDTAVPGFLVSLGKTKEPRLFLPLFSFTTRLGLQFRFGTIHYMLP